MNNQYEERLGTERMLPLIFKMALPAVAAQFVNLLYNIVDRIYIGHIPEIGTNALAGVGVTTSIVILISSFSAIVGAEVRHWLPWHWDKATGACGEILRQRFHAADSVYCADFAGILLVYGAYPSVCGGICRYTPLRRRLSFSVLAGYLVCGNLYRTQYVYQFTGASQYCDVFRLDWGLAEYRARSDFYFLV